VLIRISLEALEHCIGKLDTHFSPWHKNGRVAGNRWYSAFIAHLF
jgi:hypothetical protein